MSASVLILGLGASGEASARYCLERPDRFSAVTVLDGADTPQLREVAESLAEKGAAVLLGANGLSEKYALCIASPGIPPHAPLMQSALVACEEVISEIEFAYRESTSVWVAITGTNGKTTTTALTAHLLAASGVDAVAVGNIGTPAIGLVADAGPQTVMVAEVSSFQLALTAVFHPRVAVLLNITPDHVNWHGSLEAYAEDKAKVFAHLGPGDTAVIDVDDPGAQAWVERVEASGARVLRVSGVQPQQLGAYVREGTLVLSDPDGETLRLVDAGELRIRGPHNVSNALAAAAAARAMGTHGDDIAKGLRSFEPIEHRLEPVAVVAGAEWFNDSKATNPDAVSKAIASFGDRPLILMLGGRNKGSSFGPLALEVARQARAVVLFGEACRELAQAFSATSVPVTEAAGLAEAVESAARIAQAGDAVVLSPACASFDEFENFEQRGREFKRLVSELKAQT